MIWQILYRIYRGNTEIKTPHSLVPHSYIYTCIMYTIKYLKLLAFFHFCLNDIFFFNFWLRRDKHITWSDLQRIIHGCNVWQTSSSVSRSAIRYISVSRFICNALNRYKKIVYECQWDNSRFTISKTIEHFEPPFSLDFKLLFNIFF